MSWWLAESTALADELECVPIPSTANFIVAPASATCAVGSRGGWPQAGSVWCGCDDGTVVVTEPKLSHSVQSIARWTPLPHRHSAAVTAIAYSRQSFRARPDPSDAPGGNSAIVVSTAADGTVCVQRAPLDLQTESTSKASSAAVWRVANGCPLRCCAASADHCDAVAVGDADGYVSICDVARPSFIRMRWEMPAAHDGGTAGGGTLTTMPRVVSLTAAAHRPVWAAATDRGAFVLDERVSAPAGCIFATTSDDGECLRHIVADVEGFESANWLVATNFGRVWLVDPRRGSKDRLHPMLVWQVPIDGASRAIDDVHFAVGRGPFGAATYLGAAGGAVYSSCGNGRGECGAASWRRIGPCDGPPPMAVDVLWVGWLSTSSRPPGRTPSAVLSNAEGVGPFAVGWTRDRAPV